ncbi:MAG: AAA family ATPase, partial [Candidatus Cloacimonadaceae bacterium]|nr:AAA family ATPase [Candidatus Cloacimonadaceae bacterium]
MRRLIPDLILQKAKRKQHAGKMDAVLLNIDLSGFTQLSHDLMKSSDAGAELLSDAINAIFTPALDAIESRGGFIAGFAGDAFTAVFPLRAISGAVGSALYIRDFFVEKHSQLAGSSNVHLAARIGMALGSLNWRIFSGGDYMSFSFSGSGVDSAVKAQELAPLNGIVIDEPLRRCVGNTVSTASSEAPGYYLLTETMLTGQPGGIMRSSLAQKDFVPARILDLGIEGEFREVLSCFINLSSPDDALISTIMSLAQSYGGYFNKIDFTDKGCLALVLFGAPIEYEKTAMRALEFASEVRTLAGMQARIGMTRGKAYAGFIGSAERGEYTAIGMAVNLAARFMFSTPWGGIFIDAGIREDAKDRVCCKSLGKKAFKGFPIPIEVFDFDALEITSSQSLARTRFIGRQEELRLLSALIDQCAKASQAAICNIYGEPGQGKTRLLDEMKQLHPDGIRFLSLQCDSIRREGLNPFISFVKQEFVGNNASGKSVRVRTFRRNWSVFRQKVMATNEMGDFGDELDRIESIIGGLIGLEWEGSLYSGLSAADRSGLMSAALFSLIKGFSLLKPLVLIFEDVHWIDPESLEAMDFICAQSGGLALLIIATARYRDDGSRPTLCSNERLPHSDITLDNLSTVDSEAFMTSILDARVDASLADWIYPQSLGNPFYTEQ